MFSKYIAIDRVKKIQKQALQLPYLVVGIRRMGVNPTYSLSTGFKL